MLVPQLGIESESWQWKHQVLTTGLPGNSKRMFSSQEIVCLQHYSGKCIKEPRNCQQEKKQQHHTSITSQSREKDFVVSWDLWAWLSFFPLSWRWQVCGQIPTRVEMELDMHTLGGKAAEEQNPWVLVLRSGVWSGHACCPTCPLPLLAISSQAEQLVLIPLCVLHVLWGPLGEYTHCQAWTRLCWSSASNKCSLGAYQLDCFLNGDSLRDFVLRMLFFLTLSCEVSDQAAVSLIVFLPVL